MPAQPQVSTTFLNSCRPHAPLRRPAPTASRTPAMRQSYSAHAQQARRTTCYLIQTPLLKTNMFGSDVACAGIKTICASTVSVDSDPDSAFAAAIAEGRFVFEADEVASWKRELNLTDSELLERMISPAAKLARPPISGYYVSAVAMGVSGRVFIGVNLEFGRLPMQTAVHAEQFLIANATRMQERQLVHLAVSAAPCGHCRQFMTELPHVDTMAIKVIGKPQAFLSELLPSRFGPEDLLTDESIPRLLGDRHNGLVLTKEASEVLSTEGAEVEIAAKAALEAANGAYTPYSGCPAGMAVRTSCGEVYSGGAIESCAFNPGMSPLQTTLVATLAEGGHGWEEVCTAVLVELPGAAVQHADVIELALRRIAPGARLLILAAEHQK